MYVVSIRFVSDSKGLLEDKPKRVVVTLAYDHETALQQAFAHFFDLRSAGVVVKYYPAIRYNLPRITSAHVKRDYRFVNDHGEIFRMSTARYRAYLLAGTRAGKDKFPNAKEYGEYIGSAVTVNNFTSVEFSEEYKRK
jgi:hypothetical protein